MAVTPFYAPSSFWNTKIQSGASYDQNSDAIIATSVAPYVGNANLANTDDWGISLVYASPSDKTYTIGGAIYFDTGPVSFKIPAGARPTTGSDHHLVVIDGNKELDLWGAAYNAATDTWTAKSRFVEDITGWGANGPPGAKAGGAVAAGFSEMGGVVRPEEIAQGHIDHALSIELPVIRSNYIASPATFTDGTTNSANAIPEGAHIQLDPNFNVDAQNWAPWEKVIAKALQTYGAYVSDHGGSVAIYGQTDINAGNSTWASVGVPKGPSLANLPWNMMHVLTIPSASAGAAPPPPPPPPVVTPDTLALLLSEDRYNGDAKFIAKVDGKQIASNTVTTLHSSGKSQTFNFSQVFGAGKHDLEIDFVNDAYGGANKDRNLYIDSVKFNGTSYLSHGEHLFNNGAIHITIGQ